MALCDEDKPYVFISYSHRDSEKVVTIMNCLRAEGFNIWYDGGIDPGTEWDENIATHIKGCSYFIAFISNGYIASKNCKDELNYSRDIDKDQLLVYLEDVQLPDGMAMRMNRIQAIYWSKYDKSNIDEAYQKLFNAKGIDKAKVNLINGESAENVATEQYTMPIKIDSANNKNGKSKENNKGITIGIIAAITVIAIVTIFLIVTNISKTTDEALVEETAEKSKDFENTESFEEKDVAEANEEVIADKSDKANEKTNVEVTSNGDSLYASSTDEELWETVRNLYDQKQYNAAYDMLIELANRDDSIACGYLAFYYGQEEKSGDKVDYEIAKEWGEKGIAIGDKNSGYPAFALQYIYYTGNGDDHKGQNYDLALKYGLLAIEKGCYNGASYLADTYRFGYSLEGKDSTKAMEYYKLAVEKNKEGLSAACVGFMYDWGEGVDPDYAKAFEYYQLALEYNHPYCNLSIGDMYKNGHMTDGLTKELAVNCFQYILDNYPNMSEWCERAQKGLDAIK